MSDSEPIAKPQDKGGMKISPVKIVSIAIVVAILALAVFGFYSFNGKSMGVSDREIRYIPTGSMDGAPQNYEIKTIPQYSLVMIEHISANDIATKVKIGDVLTYDLDGRIIVHRVIAIDISTQTLTLKGDANASPDAPVAFSQVTGKVIGVSHVLGEIVHFVKTTPLILMIALILCGVVAIWALWEIIVIINRDDRESEETAEEKKEETAEEKKEETAEEKKE